MATSQDDMNQKLTFRMYEDGDDKWSRYNDKIFKEDTSHKCPVYVQRTPPCQGSCPSGHDIRGWLDIVRGIELPQKTLVGKNMLSDGLLRRILSPLSWAVFALRLVRKVVIVTKLKILLELTQ